MGIGRGARDGWRLAEVMPERLRKNGTSRRGGLWGVIARGASVAEKGKEPAPGANEWN